VFTGTFEDGNHQTTSPASKTCGCRRSRGSLGETRITRKEYCFDEPDTDDKSDEERLDGVQTEALEGGHVLQFMLALLDHILGDNEYTSALVSSMAVLGISAKICNLFHPTFDGILTQSAVSEHGSPA
jgi:hypothetical protein